MMRRAKDWLQTRAQLTPENTAIIDRTGKVVSKTNYREWNNRCNQTALYLKEKLGLVSGDSIAILSDNCPEYLDLVFACNKIGVVLQHLNWRLSVYELERILEQKTPKAIIYSDRFDSTIQYLALEEIKGIDNWISTGTPLMPGHRQFEERFAFSSKELERADIGYDDTWFILYTGGTTGEPKGVMVTYANVLANAQNTITSWGLTEKDCYIVNSPLFHSLSLNGFLTPLVMVGGSVVVCSQFDVDETYELIKEEIANIISGVPTMFAMIADHPLWEETSFDHFKLVISGGAPVPESLYKRYWERGILYKSGYGLTEAGPNNVWLPDKMVMTKPGSVGYPMLLNEMRLVDEAGIVIDKPDTPGEIQIQGPHCTPGYINNPEATKALFTEDDWLRTGDIGYRNEDGCWYISGRRNDCYISGGENIYPAEIESVISTYFAVKEAMVIGIEDEKWGEVGKLVISLRENQTLCEQEFISWLRLNIASYKIPKYIQVVKEIPKTATGKLDRSRVKELYSQPTN